MPGNEIEKRVEALRDLSIHRAFFVTEGLGIPLIVREQLEFPENNGRRKNNNRSGKITNMGSGKQKPPKVNFRDVTEEGMGPILDNLEEQTGLDPSKLDPEEPALRRHIRIRREQEEIYGTTPEKIEQNRDGKDISRGMDD